MLPTFASVAQSNYAFATDAAGRYVDAVRLHVCMFVCLPTESRFINTRIYMYMYGNIHVYVYKTVGAHVLYTLHTYILHIQTYTMYICTPVDCPCCTSYYQW